MRLQFRASNNKVEYEALLIGLRVARNVGTAQVIVYLDSQLVVQQVKGVFEVKYEKLHSIVKR